MKTSKQEKWKKVEIKKERIPYHEGSPKLYQLEEMLGELDITGVDLNKPRGAFHHEKYHKDALDNCVVFNDAWASMGVCDNKTMTRSIDYLEKTKLDTLELKEVTSKELYDYLPDHAHSEGSGGFSSITRWVSPPSAGMGNVVSYPIASGCPALCAFCQESFLDSSYASFTINHKEAKIGLRELRAKLSEEFPDIRDDLNITASVKVKFYDTENDLIIHGPIRVPLFYGFPINKKSLYDIVTGKSYRVLDD